MPHPRVADRQVTCGDTCRAARRRRACKAWREANAIEERDERLRRRIRSPPTAGGPGGLEPGAQIQWDVVRNSVSPETAVIIHEVTQIVVLWVRGEMAAQVLDK